MVIDLHSKGETKTDLRRKLSDIYKLHGYINIPRALHGCISIPRVLTSVLPAVAAPGSATLL